MRRCSGAMFGLCALVVGLAAWPADALLETSQPQIHANSSFVDVLPSGESLFRQKRSSEWNMVGRRATSHEIMHAIFRRFPRLDDHKKQTIVKSLRRTSPNELRKAVEILKKICPNPHNCNLLPPLRALNYTLQFAPNKKLATCIIPKNLSTLLSTIMCYLYAKERFKTERPDFYEQRGSYSWEKVEHKTGLRKQDYHKLIFVRNPTERFMSAFEHVCEKPERCFGCQSHECVLDRIYRGIKNYLNRGISITAYDMIPKHFALHFYPQTWRCNFADDVQSSYTVMHVSSKKSKDLAKMMDNFLLTKNVSVNDIAFLHNKIVSGRTPHATVNKHRQKNRNDKHTLLETPRYLRKYLSIFFFDYLLLGYPLPNPELLR